MMLCKGLYRARLTETEDDLRAAQRLRWLAFVGRHGGVSDPDCAIDTDEFDQTCLHMLIEDQRSNQLLATFRFMLLQSGAEIERSYSASQYDLAALREFSGQMVEMGRFCIHPQHHDPDILRISWGAMTRFIDDHDVQLLFGCSSFSGTDIQGYADTFALLKERHLGPGRWLPRVKAPKVFRFARMLRQVKPDLRRAQAGLPPLLRSYLMMGGWVSDHAVVDDRMNTLHVFTGLEIASIPPGRQRLLREVAG